MTNPTPREVADQFKTVIREWLNEVELRTVVRRNRTCDDTVCATHDFCDANMAMAEAFRRLGVAEETLLADHSNEGPLTAIWNEAWRLAKREDFAA